MQDERRVHRTSFEHECAESLRRVSHFLLSVWTDGQ